MKNHNSSEAVRYLYVCSKLTYEEMSKITNIKIDTLANWITGRRNPPIYVVESIYSKMKRFLSPDEQRIAGDMIKGDN